MNRIKEMATAKNKHKKNTAKKKANNISELSPKKWLVFVGMPASGKSTIGMNVAKMIKVPFFDSDREIERIATLSTSQIFELYGEDEFRRLEKSVIKRILQGTPAVLSLGGGAFENEATRKLILNNAYSIWLDIPLDVIYNRIIKSTQRPMFEKAENKKELLRALAKKRTENFKKATYRFSYSGDSSKSMSKKLITFLYNRKCFNHKSNQDERGDN